MLSFKMIYDTDPLMVLHTMRVSGDGFTDETAPIVCASSWCTGDCGFPALVIRVDGIEYKAMGEMVACGRAFQQFRVTWTGSRIETDAELHPGFEKWMWW
jgi:hypothetical protein